MITREQRRAQDAYDAVSGVSQNKEVQPDYKGFAKSFPVLIQTSGLAQALAFGQRKDPVVAKQKEKPNEQALEQLSYMRHLARIVDKTKYANVETFYEDARQAPFLAYQKLTRDALAAATWLKRYAEALLKSREGDTNEQP